MSNNPHAKGAVLEMGVPLERAALAVILLHGRGGSAEDILGLASAFDLPDIAYRAPQAAGSSWYPNSFLAPREQNEPFLSSALAKVEAVIRSLEQAGFSRRRMVLAGFSQGACLATEFAAVHAAPYGGLIAFTGGLIGPPGSVGIDRFPAAGLAGTPALLTSGDPDPHVPWVRVEESADILGRLGARVTLKRYPGLPHTISREQLDLARNLLVQTQEQVFSQ